MSAACDIPPLTEARARWGSAAVIEDPTLDRLAQAVGRMGVPFRRACALLAEMHAAGVRIATLEVYGVSPAFPGGRAELRAVGKGRRAEAAVRACAAKLGVTCERTRAGGVWFAVDVEMQP